MNKTENFKKILLAVYLVVLALFISALVYNQAQNTYKISFYTYKISFNQKYIDYLEALSHTKEMLIRALKDRPLLFDENWKKEMGQSLETLNLKSDELAKLKPFPKYSNLHAITVNLADETHFFSDALMKSINGLDINNSNIDLSVSIMHMDNMDTMMKEIGLELEKINKELEKISTSP